MSTNINSIGELVDQGENITLLAKEFERTIDEIYDLYNNLRGEWTGEKSDEYKRKIDELHDPLKIITSTVNKQGSAVQAAGEAFQKFERS